MSDIPDNVQDAVVIVVDWLMQKHNDAMLEFVMLMGVPAPYGTNYEDAARTLLALTEQNATVAEAADGVEQVKKGVG